MGVTASGDVLAPIGRADAGMSQSEASKCDERVTRARPRPRVIASNNKKKAS